ncbi:SDR family oxidoreductase [Pseudomonas asiatica]|jgi:2,3-dihydroxy-2,3-dihydro-p-cumate dehydrogenase|uniref:2,3-dihydroxy-2,3-dihydro-p-cumate dehydrogenase n=5 Tax=Pseudomonas putida group TaxID=136845 RepID=CMTB_PSEPU|nr:MULTISPECIES: SDR family oxidoreductase [Pseudomonas]A5W4G5.1 RecName: Full=2,3-dihydroxy-2,3-dihydro-p-cumate dehydrogenase; AltName: Full=Biphenyl-2,3-dihydro-2,3-diol dehydrogenase [Pseudomonas putida F1]P0C622.1 RecName: Full=2,3-dihydroxy-2,3-dihydro-p-cumate dehydrogenase; AltName: Full=Biphenyl-2,3-dihydro-2,3-diol dehydrogenase [Pseudomonas putida]AAB62288.1 2,3-dihydroxy-2,3-dihydro-p-cumate dehydrogenase [Pseudomonas putida]ABA10797.1 2,3-dihydroxy-2,3-dihydro-p-cumate dehydrogenas
MSTLSRNALPLEGQVAVVTGGAHGIGLGIVERLLGLGARVTASDIDESGLSLLCERLAAKHADAIAVHAADLSEEQGAQGLHRAAVERFGSVQILVNCAGGGVIRPFLEHTPETLKATIDRNLWTALWCSRVFLPDMLARQYGRIINIGADSVRNGLPDHAAYNAAKGGMHGLTTGLAREFARQGVTVNTVAPCAVNTEVWVRIKNANPELAQRFLDVIPMGRVGEIEEVASMVGYLAQPEAAFVTGQVISVNGGSTML